MNKKTFVHYLFQAAVVRNAINVREELTEPSLKKPSKIEVILREWYASLSEYDKNRLHAIIELTSYSSLFRVLCILDGTSSINDPEVRREIDILIDENGHTESLFFNKSDAYDLHDLLQEDHKNMLEKHIDVLEKDSGQ